VPGAAVSSNDQFNRSLQPVLLALADDELVIGHRHSEWTGWAPHLEEDIAFSSIAQDEIGHANLYYGMLSEVSGRSPDELALGRSANEYVNAIICERPNRDWAYTLARHFLYEIAERIRLESLEGSAYRPLAGASEKLLREERYHQMHADAWFRRLSSGPLEGRHQFSLALSEALPDAIGLFEELPDEDLALAEGVLTASSNTLMQLWLADVIERIESAGLPLDLEPDDDATFVATSAGEMLEEAHQAPRRPSIVKSNGAWELRGEFSGLGGRRGRHTEAFEELWADLTRTYREEPTATW
jgi:ring-1,2-phenylacetyl-CoA epoxidase subunit PaaC